MELLTKEIRKKLPTIEVTDNQTSEHQRVYLKLFCPAGRMTWYATSFDGNDTFFGFVVGPFDETCDEVGEFSLQKLKELKGPLGYSVERDKFWDDKTTLAQVISGEKR